MPSERRGWGEGRVHAKAQRRKKENAKARHGKAGPHGLRIWVRDILVLRDQAGDFLRVRFFLRRGCFQLAGHWGLLLAKPRRW
jgi:hypothetical protein